MNLDAHPPTCALDRIGDTPMLEVDGIFVKLECANPSGSVKDRIARYMVQEAVRRGDLAPGDTIVETTSGNTGIALAMVARELGYRLVIYMPEHMSPERRDMMKRLGAEVRLTPREQGFEGAIRERDAYRHQPGHWVPDQFANPDNARCHEETTGAEIVSQLNALGCDRLDAFVAGVGTGGTLMGVGRRLRTEWPAVEIVAVEPTESNALCGRPAGEHGIMGIGDGFVPDLVDRDLIDEVMTVTTEEAVATTGLIWRSHGFCVGVSSGANMAVALRLARTGASVVTLWPDSADRYASVGLPIGRSRSRCALQPYCRARARALLS
jgi:cysteine synthase